MITCEECGHEHDSRLCPDCKRANLQDSVFCSYCGRKFPKGDEPVKKGAGGDPFDLDNRVLCGDGSCIGVIDQSGLCTECGRPLSETRGEEEEE